MKITLINNKPAILLDSGDVLIKDISCGLRYTEGEAAAETLLDCSWTLEDDGCEAVAVSENAKIRFATEGDGIRLRTEFKYCGRDLERSEEFIVMKGALSDRVKKIFANTLHENNGLKTTEMLSSALTLDLKDGEKLECGDFAALVLASDAKYIAGVLTYNEFFSGLNISEDGTCEMFQITERLPVKDGDVLTSDLFCILPCDDIVTALPEYCKLSASLCGGPRKKRETPSGSCTWYYYLSDINEDIISRCVDDMAQNREMLPLKYMQIDDGWQVFYGQWEPNEKFPSGMKAAADKIKSEGFVPGLWFAPLWANKARVREEHPEYFNEFRDGSRSICFDMSVPETCEYIKEVYRNVTCDWGYKYLKLDAITPVLGNYNFKDPKFNSLKNYKRILRVIDEATPPDTYILGCTAPFGAAVGLVDGMRVSCDVAGRWESVRDVFQSVLKRYYYHNNFFTNDSDCLSVRMNENEDAECSEHEHCTRTLEENRTFISATAAAGGIFMSSDKLRLLDDSQKESISYLFPQNEEAALPLDLMDSQIPGILDCGSRGKIRTVILINWEDEEKEMSYDLSAPSHVFEFWSKSYKGVQDGKYTSRIAPHCCEVLHITSADEPAVISSGNALVPQISQEYKDGKLTASFEKRGEVLYIACSGSITSDAELTKVCDGIYSVKDTGTTASFTVSAE